MNRNVLLVIWLFICFVGSSYVLYKNENLYWLGMTLCNAMAICAEILKVEITEAIKKGKQ